MKIKQALVVATAVAVIGSGGIYFAQNSRTGEPIVHEPVVSAPSAPETVTVTPIESGEILPDAVEISTPIEGIISTPIEGETSTPIN